MKAIEKLISMIDSFMAPEEIAKGIRWNDLSDDDREKLLVKAEEMRDSPQGLQLLKTLHFLALNKDEIYDCRGLLLVLDRQDIKGSTREQVSGLIDKRVKNSLKNFVSDARQLKRMQDYFVIRARYALYLANAAYEKENLQDAIRFLQSAYESFRLAESEDLAAEVEQKLLKLLNQDAIVKLQDQTIELNQAISALTAQAAGKQQEIHDQDENLNRQKSQILEGQKFLQGIVNKISDAQRMVADHKNELDSLKSEIKETRNELGTLGRLKSLTQVIPELEGRKQQLENSVAGLANQKNQLKSALLPIAQEYEDMKSHLAAAQDLDAQKQALLAEIADAQSKLESLQLENQTTETEYKSKDKMRRKLAEIRQEKAALLAEIGDLQTKADETKSFIQQNASLKAAEKALQAEIRRMNKKKEDLKKQSGAQAEQNQDLNQQIDPLTKNKEYSQQVEHVEAKEG